MSGALVRVQELPRQATGRVVAVAQVGGWDQAWRLPADQGGHVITCGHRHRRAIAAADCLDRWSAADHGWHPLGIRPAP